MSVIAFSRMNQVAFRLCGALCLLVLVGLLAACGGGKKSDSFALAEANVALDGWEHCSALGTCNSVSAAQGAADQIVGQSNVSTSDKKKLLNKMLDWAEINEPAAEDSITRRLDSLG